MCIRDRDIFEKLTEDEREQLAEGYRALKAIKVINDTENFIGYDENSGDIIL